MNVPRTYCCMCVVCCGGCAEQYVDRFDSVSRCTDRRMEFDRKMINRVLSNDILTGGETLMVLH